MGKAHDLAGLCRLNVPEAKLEKFSNLWSTYLIKRFDRVLNKRVHFASVMTLLGKTDGASAEDISTAARFGISETDAKDYAKDILAIVRENWEKTASGYEINRRQIEEMRPAFSDCYEWVQGKNRIFFHMESGAQKATQRGTSLQRLRVTTEILRMAKIRGKTTEYP